MLNYNCYYFLQLQSFQDLFLSNFLSAEPTSWSLAQEAIALARVLWCCVIPGKDHNSGNRYKSNIVYNYPSSTEGIQGPMCYITLTWWEGAGTDLSIGCSWQKCTGYKKSFKHYIPFKQKWEAVCSELCVLKELTGCCYTYLNSTLYMLCIKIFSWSSNILLS